MLADRRDDAAVTLPPGHKYSLSQAHRGQANPLSGRAHRAPDRPELPNCASSPEGDYSTVDEIVTADGGQAPPEPQIAIPPAEHLCTGAACRTARRPVPASAIDGERPGATQRDTSDTAWRPAGQAAGHPAIPASGQRDDEALEASAGNDAVVAAYRLSVRPATDGTRLAIGNLMANGTAERVFGPFARPALPGET